METNKTEIELVDYAMRIGGPGLAILMISMALGILQIIGLPMFLAGGIFGLLLFIIGLVLMVIDPMYVRTGDTIRIEWQWLRERTSLSSIN